jgi:hypothetical protein
VKQLLENWREESAAPERPAWVAEFSDSPFWQTVFHWDKSRTLARNPIAWLQEYSWTARLTKWGWFGGLLFAEFICLSGPVAGSQVALTAALASGVAFSAVGSFRRERQTGLLELLLVSPLSVRQVINGRLWGIFCHYFPAITVLIVGWYGDRALSPQLHAAGLANLVFPNPVTFGLLMVVGFYLSLSSFQFLLAWLLTWLLAFVGPNLAVLVMARFGSAMPRIIPLALQLAAGTAVLFLVHRNVKLRKFLRPEN